MENFLRSNVLVYRPNVLIYIPNVTFDCLSDEMIEFTKDLVDSGYNVTFYACFGNSSTPRFFHATGTSIDRVDDPGDDINKYALIIYDSKESLISDIRATGTKRFILGALSAKFFDVSNRLPYLLQKPVPTLLTRRVYDLTSNDEDFIRFTVQTALDEALKWVSVCKSDVHVIMDENQAENPEIIRMCKRIYELSKDASGISRLHFHSIKSQNYTNVELSPGLFNDDTDNGLDALKYYRGSMNICYIGKEDLISLGIDDNDAIACISNTLKKLVHTDTTRRETLVKDNNNELINNKMVSSPHSIHLLIEQEEALVERTTFITHKLRATTELMLQQLSRSLGRIYPSKTKTKIEDKGDEE